MIEIAPATYADAAYVGENLRADDVRELRDINGVSPFLGVYEAFHSDGEKWAARKDGVPFALFGCALVGILAPYASPWFLGTQEVRNARVPMLRETRKIVHSWYNKYGLLENTADGRNKTTLRWLRAIGFTLHNPVLLPSGVPTVNFEMTRN